MYYLIKYEDNKPKIIGNYENKHLKIWCLLKYLDTHNIKYVDFKEELTFKKNNAKYCYKVNDNEYIVLQLNNIKDGWFISGYQEYIELYKIYIQNYDIINDVIFQNLKKEIIRPDLEIIR